MLTTDEVIQVAIAVALSLLSGTGVYLMEVRQGKLEPSVFNYITECFTAVTAGLMAFFAEYRSFDDFVCYLSVLLASNNGKEITHMAKNINREAIAGLLIKMFTKGGK